MRTAGHTVSPKHRLALDEIETIQRRLTHYISRDCTKICIKRKTTT